MKKIRPDKIDNENKRMWNIATDQSFFNFNLSSNTFMIGHGSTFSTENDQSFKKRKLLKQNIRWEERKLYKKCENRTLLTKKEKNEILCLTNKFFF